MPEISRFFGIVIKMFFDDHNPPHFHAEYGDDVALVDIRTLAVFSRNGCRREQRALSLSGRRCTNRSFSPTGIGRERARNSRRLHLWNEPHAASRRVSTSPLDNREQREIFGLDPWPYNLEDNRKALEAVIRYEYEQGMIKKKPAIEDLFFPPSLQRIQHYV